MRTPVRTLSVLSLGALLVGGVSFPSSARADRKNPLDGQPSLRHKVELRKSRFEITPQFVISTNQDFRMFVGGGIQMQYHLTDWLGIALQAAGGGGVDTQLTSSIDQLLAGGPNTNITAPTPFQPTSQQFHDHLATINAIFSLYAVLTPAAGKLAIFNAGFVRYDLYGMFGVGGMYLSNTFDSSSTLNTPDLTCSDPGTPTNPNTCNPNNAGIVPTGMFGIGVHLFFNEFVGLNVELRDFLGSTNLGGLDVNGDRKIGDDDKTISNNLFLGVGITFMLPIHAQISP